MSVSCERCVLSGRGLCVGLITRPEESTECGVSECDPRQRRRLASLGAVTSWCIYIYKNSTSPTSANYFAHLTLLGSAHWWLSQS